MHDLHYERGFTLIEISIVLVIIGLIVGGVLVGQEMIKAAQIRAVISQIEKYNTAVNTFRDKYAGMPGDLNNGTTFWAAAVNGDGNSILTDTNGTVANASTDFSDATGELINFFYELSQSNLVDGQFSNIANATPLATGGNYPMSKLGRGGIIPMALDGQNRFHIGMKSSDLTASTVFAFADTTFTPLEALQVDTKMDDGRPGTGSVLARIGAVSAVIAITIPVTGNNNCLATVTTYNVGSVNADADTLLCQLQIRMN